MSHRVLQFVDVLPAVASQNLQLTNSCLIDVEHKLGKLSLINSYLDSRLRVDGDAFICNVDTRLPYIKVCCESASIITDTKVGCASNLIFIVLRTLD